MIDIAKLAERSKKSKEAPVSSGAGKYFRASEAGTYKLRLADKWNDDPFFEFYLNYNLDSTPFAVEDKEYLAQKGWKYYDKTDDKDSPRRKLWNKIMPVTRYYANVIDENNPDQGVKIWSMSKKTYEKLIDQALKIAEDKEDVLEYAFELKVEKKAMFTESTIQFDRKKSDPGYEAKKEDLHDIKSSLTFRSNEQIDTLVNNAALNAGVVD